MNFLSEFQQKSFSWSISTFGSYVANDHKERSYRFIEESLELVQANDISKEDVLKLVDYVFSREKGSVPEEIGDVLVTLSILASSHGHNMSRCANTTLNKCILNSDKIYQKHLSKPVNNGPIPGEYETPKTSFNKLAETIKEAAKQL